MRAVKDGLPTPSGDGEEIGGPRSTHAVETTPVASLEIERRKVCGKWRINQDGLDDVHESAENVPRVFLFLMDVGIED